MGTGIIVAKIGGNVLSSSEALAGLAADIALLQSKGFKPVVVHGGGCSIDKALEAVGIEPKRINGLRVTDAATLGVVFLVLDAANATICAAVANAQPFPPSLTPFTAVQVGHTGATDMEGNVGAAHAPRAAGGTPAVHSSAQSGGTEIEENELNVGAAHAPRAADLGFVGEITGVDTTRLNAAICEGLVPVVAPIGVTAGGQHLNINADHAAVAIATALNAEQLLFLSDVPGILGEQGDKSSLLPKLSAAECEQLMNDGTISGGMVPKVQTAISALNGGVEFVSITDGLAPQALANACLQRGNAGTVLSRR